MRKPHRVLLASLLLLAGLWLISDALLHATTAPGVPPHAVLRVAGPGVDLGIDVQPAQTDAAGYVELWVYPHTSDDYRPLLRVYGAPALGESPAPREERPVPTPTAVWRAL